LLRQQRTLVVSTHDEEFAREFATRIIRLRDGVVV
jgi:ABC-type polar amino acid transport system ATPase subunit